MQVSVRLSEDMAKRLTKLSEETKRTKSFYIKEALAQYLENYEDYMDALKAIKETGEGAPTYTLEEMKERYGVEL